MEKLHLKKLTSRMRLASVLLWRMQNHRHQLSFQFQEWKTSGGLYSFMERGITGCLRISDWVIIIGIISVCPVNLCAQNSFQEIFDEFSQSAIDGYESFRDKCNSDYAAFLELSWKSFNACEAVPEPHEEQVPPVIYKVPPVSEPVPEPSPAPIPEPVIEPAPKPVVAEPVIDREIPIVEVIPPVEPVPQPQPVEPIRETPVVTADEFEFSYLDMCLSVRAGDGLRFSLPSVKAGDISKTWKKLSGRGYDNLIVDCLSIRDKYALCDWAYLQMLKSFAVSFLGSGDSATLLTAYLYAQSGYKVRLGTSSGHLYLLYGTEYVIYGKPYYQLDGSNFFVLDGNLNNMEIAACPYPGEKDMSLTISHEFLPDGSYSDTRHFKSDRYSIESECSVNSTLLKFYEDYPTAEINDNPLSRWAIYAETPVSRSVREKLYPALQKAVRGKSELEAADMLLDFVQNAFEYGYDNEIWGCDRAFFAEETLYYPYCDCEDRSILFSHLVRDLLGLDVMLVYYPGHLATAVRFSEPVDGDYIVDNQKKYTVCDPTYIGAPVGKTMPDMNNSHAKVILLRR